MRVPLLPAMCHPAPGTGSDPSVPTGVIDHKADFEMSEERMDCLTRGLG